MKNVYETNELVLSQEGTDHQFEGRKLISAFQEYGFCLGKIATADPKFKNICISLESMTSRRLFVSFCRPEAGSLLFPEIHCFFSMANIVL